MFGLVVCTYNRPAELQQTIQSLESSDLTDVEIIVCDDCSTDAETHKLIDNWNRPIMKIKADINHRTSNAWGLKTGWDIFYDKGMDYLLDLDSDAIVKPHWISVLLNLSKQFPNHIISGFNTPNHPITQTFDTYHTKKSIGGVNMFFPINIYPFIRQNLYSDQWDWYVCNNMRTPFIVSNPSVVQHIGKHSVSGHGFDYATDF